MGSSLVRLGLAGQGDGLAAGEVGLGAREGGEKLGLVSITSSKWQELEPDGWGVAGRALRLDKDLGVGLELAG